MTRNTFLLLSLPFQSISFNNVIVIMLLPGDSIVIPLIYLAN